MVESKQLQLYLAPVSSVCLKYVLIQLTTDPEGNCANHRKGDAEEDEERVFEILLLRSLLDLVGCERLYPTSRSYLCI